MDNIETIDFGIARAAFARHLDTDEGLRTAYAANVQMLLQDRGVLQDAAAPLARDILALIFFSPARPAWASARSPAVITGKPGATWADVTKAMIPPDVDLSDL
jgi:hypothetical protein